MNGMVLHGLVVLGSSFDILSTMYITPAICIYLMHKIKGKMDRFKPSKLKYRVRFIPCIRNLIKFCFQVTYNEVAKNETHR